MSSTPMRFTVSNFTSDFFGIGVTGNDRIAIIVFFRVVEFYRFLNDKIPFFSFCGKDGEDRTRDLTVIISRPVVDGTVRK